MKRKGNFIMEDLLIHNVRLNEEETELFLLLLNLGFGQYLDELFSEFTGDKNFDQDCLKTAILEVQELLTKFGFEIDFEIKMERKEK